MELTQSYVVLERLEIFKCDKCPEIFTSQSQLNAHSISLNFKCSNCDMHFHQLRDRQMHELKHVNRVHKNPTPHKINKEKPFKCAKCQAAFVLESTLFSHSIVHLPLPHVCECGISYYSKTDLNSHKTLVHPQTSKLKTWKPKINISKLKLKQRLIKVEPVDTDDEILPVKDRRVLKPRLKANIVIKTEKKKKNTKLRILDEFGDTVVIKRNENKRYECPSCDKTYIRRKLAIEHYSEHIGVKSYSCKHCDMKFFSEYSLKIHDIVHNGSRFQCDYCYKEFATKNNLIIHVRTHTGERPYECDTCHMRFTQISSLKTHKKTHTGEKNHVCQHCNKAFTEYHNMKTHERIHTQTKPYKCGLCEKAFSDPSAYKRHTIIHTGLKPFGCKQCPKRFSDPSALYVHRLRHTLNRRHPCEICPSKFYTKSDLKLHIYNVHIKDKPFQCDECKNNFNTKNNLKLHILRMHGDKCICKMCKKRVGTRSELNKHLKTCLGITLYCQCMRSFASESGLKKHKLKCAFEKSVN